MVKTKTEKHFVHRHLFAPRRVPSRPVEKWTCAHMDGGWRECSLRELYTGSLLNSNVSCIDFVTRKQVPTAQKNSTRCRLRGWLFRRGPSFILIFRLWPASASDRVD